MDFFFCAETAFSVVTGFYGPRWRTKVQGKERGYFEAAGAYRFKVDGI